jgi:VanZ family protein
LAPNRRLKDPDPAIEAVMNSNLLFRVAAWLLAGCLLALTVVPASERPSTGVPHSLEHILAFLLLGTLFALGYSNHLLRLLAGTFAFTLLLELSQVPLPTRHARLSDFLYDSLATWIGIALIYLLPKRLGIRRP